MGVSRRQTALSFAHHLQIKKWAEKLCPTWLRFIRATCFTYSSREGTKAATLPNQVANGIKKQRSQQLHELANDMKLKFCQDNIGHEFSVLWEGYSEALEGAKQRVFGYTPNYLRVGCVISEDESVENQIITTQLMAMEEGYIVGEIVGNSFVTKKVGFLANQG